MSLSIQLDRQNGSPIYQQIAGQIHNYISRGHLPAGAKLPTVRQLAGELGVTRLTVQNAYHELQADGLVEATVGKGTFVANAIRPNILVADISTNPTPDRVLYDRDAISQIAGLRSMAYAYPDNALLPTAEFWQSLTMTEGDLPDLLQYGSALGDPVLRVELATLLQERGIAAMPDDIMVVGGMTHANALAARLLAQPGDTVLVEFPTYFGFINTLRAQGLRAIGIPRDEAGPQLDILERIIRQESPRFFYTIPNFHNPTGWSMTAERKQDLLSLAEKQGLFIVEDDIYGRLSYDKPAPTPLKASDRRDLVVYLDSFSKELLPGVRIGMMVVPPHLQERLVQLRGADDLFGPPLLQRTMAYFLQRKKHKQHLRKVIPVYRRRRDVLLQTLESRMPNYVSWTRPQGGFSTWLTLPNDHRLDDLYHAALQHGLAYTPGSAFVTDTKPGQHLRLCFGNQRAEAIRECIILLSDLIRERISNNQPRQDRSSNRLLSV